MRQPFSELPNRITISEEQSEARETNVYGSAICKYCGGEALPMSYIGSIPSHFICKNCEIIQINEGHPVYQNKNKEEVETPQERLKNRRIPKGKIDTKHSDPNDDPEEYFQSFGDDKRSRLRQSNVSITQSNTIKDQSMIEQEVEIDPHSKVDRNEQIETGIYRSLRNLDHALKEKEINDKNIVKEMIRGKK